MKTTVFFGVALLASALALSVTEAAATKHMAKPAAKKSPAVTRVASATPPKGTSDATIKNFTMPNITVAAGTTVTWHNSDGEPHTVVSVDGLFRSAALDTGESFSFKFTKTGTFKYACTIHPRMVATVTVK
jgi:plastocyanin